jgi:hypothetical protein
VQSIFNQMIRTVFWMFVRLPLTIGQKIMGGSKAAAKIGASQLPQEAAEDQTEYGDPYITPTSKQGQKDRRDYAKILRRWEQSISASEDLTKGQERLYSIFRDPQHPDETRHSARDTLAEMDAALRQRAQEVREYYIVPLDRLEARNQGMVALRRERKKLEERQAAIDSGIGVYH